MKRINIRYLSDRAYLSDKNIPSVLLDELRYQGLIETSINKVHFCGVVSYSDGLAVFLPRNHQATIEDGGAAGSLLLQALLKYYKEKDSGAYAQDSGDEVIGGRAFSLATALFNDYRANGLYVRRVKEQAVNSGKVNWVRTISRNTSYPASGGSVFLDLITSHSRYIADCETARIHAEVIKEILSNYGMLWLGVSSQRDERLEHLNNLPINTDAKIAYLNRELQLSYSERDIFLIKGLIQYLRIKKGVNTTNVLIGVSKFHNLWESMLDECLVGNYSVNSKLPIPVYQAANNEFISVAQKGQRTDTVLKHRDEDRFAVVDAKYYEASSPSTAPGWPDLVKQFYYQKAVSFLEGKSAKVSNHFIFPGGTQALKVAHIAERGIIVKSIGDCLEDYKPIYCHYQEPIELLDAYVNGKKLTELTDDIFKY